MARRAYQTQNSESPLVETPLRAFLFRGDPGRIMGFVLSFEREQLRRALHTAVPLLVLIVLALFYGSTLQRDINGSGNKYMIDVGEIQVALNVWGTIHHTGYPLYTILGALLVGLFRVIGLNPALSASAVSMMFSLASALVTYTLLFKRTANPLLSGGLVTALGLVQSFWIHSVVAEVYSFSALLIAVSAWWVLKDAREWQDRDWLIAAAILGTAAAHHRSTLFVVPTLVVWLLPQVTARWRHMPRILLAGTLVFSAMFIVYLYLPIRAWMGARWVAGQPGTWDGFWYEFLAGEARRLMVSPQDLAGVILNARRVLDVLIIQVGLPALIAGIAATCTLAAVRRSRHFGLSLMAGMASYCAFAIWLPDAVLLEAFLMPVCVLLVLGMAEVTTCGPVSQRVLAPMIAISAGIWAVALVRQNEAFARTVTTEPAGREAITRLATLPAEVKGQHTVVMLPWGGLYFAANYGLYVTGELSDLTLVDHRADFKAILDRGDTLLTLPATFYVIPIEQWDTWIGRAYLSSAHTGIVQIDNQPHMAADLPANVSRPFPLDNGISLLAYRIARDDIGDYHLTLWWLADRPVTADYSVYVHLTRLAVPISADDILSQADSFAPVYGLYPTSRWSVGEIVREDYLIPAPAPDYQGPQFIRAGMYRQLADGSLESHEALVLTLTP